MGGHGDISLTPEDLAVSRDEILWRIGAGIDRSRHQESQGRDGDAGFTRVWGDDEIQVYVNPARVRFITEIDR